MENAQYINMPIEQIGRCIDKICRKKGITYSMLAEQSNISVAALYRIISGNANPQLSTLQMIANALDITLVELLGNQMQVVEAEALEQKIIDCVKGLEGEKKKLLWSFLQILQEV